VPIILSYLIYSYVIFKGKVTGKEDYDPQETVNVLFIQESRKVNGTRPIQRPIHLLWVYRLLIAVAGLFFFFLVLGFFGDISAIAGIVLFILVFIIGWGYYSKKQNI
jgi:cytochrome bd-type quinol oxidase subunit 2